MSWWQRFKDWALRLKRDIKVLGLALVDPRTPWYAKALAFLIVAYALSPIDLIPDVIPVLGLIDEMILLPVFVVLVARLIPAPVMTDCRSRVALADNNPLPARLRWTGLAIIVGLWLAATISLARWAGMI